MMETTDIALQLKAGFGEALDVRARRPGGLFQVTIPAFLPDGDAATIFVRPLSNELVEVSDQGMTLMRLSYVRTDPHTEDVVAHLARHQGFRLEGGAVVARVAVRDLLGAALGLVQVEAQAESAIRRPYSKKTAPERFRREVVEAVTRTFPGSCEINYRDEADKDGLYAVDAMVKTPRRWLPVVAVPGDVDAERAVATKLFLDPRLRGAHPMRWVAVPRDVNDLGDRTRRRLLSQFYAVVADSPEEIGGRLADLAA